MLRTVAVTTLFVLSCSAQILVPEGTKVRVRLDQSVSSATAEDGQVVEFTVADPVRVGDTLVIAEGSRAEGTVTQAHEKTPPGPRRATGFAAQQSSMPASAAVAASRITIDYRADGSVFPLDMSAPAFVWRDPDP